MYLDTQITTKNNAAISYRYNHNIGSYFLCYFISHCSNAR